jgi:hypothetical protein
MPKTYLKIKTQEALNSKNIGSIYYPWLGKISKQQVC